VFVGTRVPFQTLLDYLEAGQPLAEFLDDFPTVSRDLAVAALEQAKEALFARARPLDECLPRRLKNELVGHDARTVHGQQEWRAARLPLKERAGARDLVLKRRHFEMDRYADRTHTTNVQKPDDETAAESKRKVAAPLFAVVSHWLVVIALVASSVSACRTAPETPAFDAGSAASSVQRSLPAEWAVAETRSNEIPFGHYWGDSSGPYRGQRGTLLIVTEPKPVSVWSSGGDGRSHRDPIAVESFGCLVNAFGLPQQLATLLSMHAPLQPDCIFADERVRVYARPSHRLTISEQQFKDQILTKGTEINWPESPWNEPARLSWGSWQTDLRRALAGDGQQ
jgi:hypothetical protein